MNTETREMNRADDEEMTIYANADIMNDDLRTGMEDSDAKRRRTLQCTGSDSVWSRMYGAVACLVLLCVLLLIPIIVLRVQLNTETRQCQSDNKIFQNERSDLMQEREKLRNENTMLKNNEKQLQSKIVNLTEEINHKIFKNERRQFVNNDADLVKEKNQLVNNNRDLMQEREKLRNENTMLKYNEKQLQSKIVNLTEEINQLLAVTNVTIPPWTYK